MSGSIGGYQLVTTTGILATHQIGVSGYYSNGEFAANISWFEVYGADMQLSGSLLSLVTSKDADNIFTAVFEGWGFEYLTHTMVNISASYVKKINDHGKLMMKIVNRATGELIKEFDATGIVSPVTGLVVSTDFDYKTKITGTVNSRDIAPASASVSKSLS